MTLNAISFGNKIPVAKCNIRDVRQNKFVEATLVEFDCKDNSDVEEIEKLDENWEYKDVFRDKMKYTRSIMRYKVPLNHFYALKNENGEIVGIAQVKDERPDFVLNHIESKKGQYKFIGQNMIAMLSKIALENNFKRLYVPIPIEKARAFYTKKCGFRDIFGDCGVALSTFGMKRFQRKVNKRTNAS